MVPLKRLAKEAITLNMKFMALNKRKLGPLCGGIVGKRHVSPKWVPTKPENGVPQPPELANAKKTNRPYFGKQCPRTGGPKFQTCFWTFM